MYIITDREIRAVSPVIGVILLIVVVVALSALASTFVFNIGNTQTGIDPGVSIQNDIKDGTLHTSVIKGSPDEIIIIRNGTIVKKESNPKVGEEYTISAPRKSTISVVYQRDGSNTTLFSTTVSASKAGSDGSSITTLGETISWNTSSDWDNATTNDVLHSSETVQMKYIEDFEDKSSKFQKYIVGPYGNAGITSSNPINGSYSYYVESPDNTPDFGYINFDWDNVTIAANIKLNESIDADSIGLATRFETTGGNAPYSYTGYDARKNNVLRIGKRTSSNSALLAETSQSNSGIVRYRITSDGAMHKYYSMGTLQLTATDGERKSGGIALTAGEVDARYDNIVVRSLDGSILTTNKSFSAPTRPDIMGLTYSLNSGSINITVIGSPGTASEERQTVSLDGSSSYDLSWADSHQDFKIKIELDGTETSTPSLSNITLSG